AMRSIEDGVVDREGVRGLARRLHVGERHLHRTFVAELGVPPQAVARAQRAQTARTLIETTSLSFTEIAFAAGFASIRQFNDTVREVFAATPTALRAARNGRTAGAAGRISLRLPYRTPFNWPVLLRFLGRRALTGVESTDGETFRRTLALPHGCGIAWLSDAGDHIRCVLRLDDVRDLSASVHRCRRLLDLDADPIAVDGALASSPVLREAVAAHPGLRVPGAVDGFELAVRTILGQQVSVEAARTLAGRLVAASGEPLGAPDGDLTHTFPAPAELAAADLSGVGITAARRATLQRVSAAVADGELAFEPGSDREETRRKLLELPGIGPWTASSILMRALRSPDEFLPTDLGVKRALQTTDSKAAPEDVAEAWRPWRSYALQHLWNMPVSPTKEKT
ncbi:MAG: helix-turn-helix domain-containing protein, partial [Actinomycetota bacterium]|nr:helix-turn-helix domain-containing protein [Actinomycetota bacterium]